MNKIIIITNPHYNSDKHTCQARRIQEEFKYLGVDAEIVSKIFAENVTVKKAVFLDKDLYLASELEKNGVRLFNSSEAIRICDDKMLTYLALKDCVDMPRTIAGRLRYNLYNKNEEGDKKFELDYIEGAFGYPLVLKECFGSWGKGVFLIKSREELEEKNKKLKCIPRLYQEFIAESAGTDIRVIVVGGDALGAIKRISADGFLSNANAGGVCEEIPLSKEIKQMAEKAAKVLGLDYCGVDLMLGKEDAPKLLEVNSNAYFEAFESVTKQNVANRIARHILNFL